MKLTAIIGTAIAAIVLAACGSTVASTGTPTPSPTGFSTPSSTVGSTPSPTAAPTPTGTPLPLTPPSGPPVLTALCAPSATEFAWRVSFGQTESNYNVDLSFTAGATFTLKETSTTQPYTFDTPNAPGQQLILVRWDSYPSAGVSNGTNADSDLCTATPSPTLLAVLPPKILPACQPVSGVYDWEVFEAWQGPTGITQQDQRGDFSIDHRPSPGDAWALLSSNQPSFYFETPTSDGTTLYVRWHDYAGAGTSTAQADATPCA
jgi:hypothetical protein